MLNRIQPFPNIKKTARATLPFYNKDWKPVTEFPNLSCAKTLAVDTETYDPELMKAGPGWGRHMGHMIGMSIATEDASWYFPMRHEIQKELNMDPDKVLAFCRDVLGTNIPKIFANASYDVGWLQEEGVTVGGKWYDVIIAEKLIDSSKFSYNLESISDHYLGQGKVSDDVYEWCSRAYGGKIDGKQRSNLYRTPPSLVGPYAEADARLPFNIFRKQHAIMSRDNLLEVFDIETRLIPILVAMRRRGVRVSTVQAEISKRGLQEEIINYTQDLNEMAGFHVNPNSSHHLEKLFKKAGVQIQYTAKNNPSFQAAWLEGEPHPAAHKVRQIRKFNKIISTFIDGALIEKQVNGRIHCQFNQMGAITGRFSSSAPNLQNIPARDRKLGPMMRSIFKPDKDHLWIKMDYSSVEFRVFAHYIQDKILLDAYNTNPLTDFHQVVEDMVGGDLPRVVYKTLSFSRMFGGGINTIAKQMNLNFTEKQQRGMIARFSDVILSNAADQSARLIMNLYDKEFPAVSDALKKAGDVAIETGEMRTILGRRVLFNMWEPSKRNSRQLEKYERAVSRWGADSIRRAKTYKALNVFTQGSSADIMKKAMVIAWEAGLFNKDRLDVPLLTVHDELDLSITKDHQKDLLELKNIMETAVLLDVPLVVDAEVGNDWGAKSDFNLKTWSKK